MNKYKLSKMSSQNFELSSDDGVCGRLNIENNSAQILIKDDIYTVSRLGGNVLLGIKFEISNSKTDFKSSFFTNWFGLGGTLLDNNRRYKFSAGGGGVKSWHKWTWKDNNMQNSISVSTRADEVSSIEDSNDGIIVNGNIEEEQCILLILLARFFYFNYIGGK